MGVNIPTRNPVARSPPQRHHMEPWTGQWPLRPASMSSPLWQSSGTSAARSTKASRPARYAFRCLFESQLFLFSKLQTNRHTYNNKNISVRQHFCRNHDIVAAFSFIRGHLTHRQAPYRMLRSFKDCESSRHWPQRSGPSAGISPSYIFLSRSFERCKSFILHNKCSDSNQMTFLAIFNISISPMSMCDIPFSSKKINF